MPSVDPNDPSSFNHRFVIAGKGHRYHVVDQPPVNWVGNVEDAPTLLLCHGFPDLWYGYRYQIHAFAARGWRVLCPSQLGYGETDSPRDLESYSFKSVAYDMNLLLDACGVKGKVVVVGHDWGGAVAWRFVNYFPHRVLAVACVCTPYTAPATPSTPSISDETLIRKFLPNFGYQLWFKQPEATGQLEEVLEHFLQPMHSPEFRRKASEKEKAKKGMGSWVAEGRLEQSVKQQIEAKRAGKLPSPPAEKELDFYLSTYRKSGMEGPLSWYKTRAVNRAEEQEANLPPFPSHIPALQLPAELDAALPPRMCLAPSVFKSFPAGNLEVKVIEGADHWLLQDERTRDKVTNILGDWIEKVLAGKWKPSSVESRL
ncbi:Alpha/Beta hydrolase protein [Leucosporidium creatinivorum]|uniref:Alpha/Beta hydrolase protein n=1 Tax=Leucosporidium creatinivorum TaxID=106004 RepID=A0A1Y2F8P6_9BASI|nr:Alpha/Beta hydrolase protein [Leucosporidium creatinivorum]